MPRDNKGHESTHQTETDRASAALLVRCWLEPRRDAEPVVRGYVRDLRTGIEVPIADLGAIEDQVRRHLGLASVEQRDASELTA